MNSLRGQPADRGRRVTVRRLGHQDVELVLSSGESLFDNPADAHQTLAFLAEPGSDLIAAICDGSIVGFASGSVLLHPDKPPAYFINEVGVRDEWRRTGVASKLMTAIGEHARRRGCRTMWVATEHDNAAARGLYRKFNGRETEQIIMYEWDLA